MEEEEKYKLVVLTIFLAINFTKWQKFKITELFEQVQRKNLVKWQELK